MPEVKFLSLKEYDAICCIFLKGKEKTTTDISFQVSIPLIINRKGAAIPIKEKVSLTKQGSQASSPIPQHLKNENAYTAASPVSDRTRLSPTTEVQQYSCQPLLTACQGSTPTSAEAS